MPNQIPIRILHLEDDPRDAELIKNTLEDDDLLIKTVHVNNREHFTNALISDSFDVILSDFNLPDYDGFSALKHAMEKHPTTPVIMISGTINEEEAIKCLQEGATDYILKQKLMRLPTAVRRALSEAEKHRQYQEAERLVNRAQRLDSIGILASGIAHDLNNALAPIVMGAEILRMKYSAETKLLDLIENSTKRATELVRQLLGFARGLDGERVLMPVEPLVEEVSNLINASFPKNIKLVVKYDQKLPKVMGDATQLHQVLLNLCINARNAMTQGGTLTVMVEQRSLKDVDSAKFLRFVPEGKPGEYVALRVKDTGSGISPEIIDRIFEPFFTTNNSERGTGLGLSSVIGIVKGHGGFLQVYSELGKGSSFTVYLPIKDSNSDTKFINKSAVKLHERRETILIVDDEPAIRMLTTEALKSLRFNVFTASDGLDGMEQVRKLGSDLSAIITDLHMPNMDGLTFARSARQILPNIPILLISGSVDDAALVELEALGMTALLDKPFSAAQLIQTLESLLATK